MTPNLTRILAPCLLAGVLATPALALDETVLEAMQDYADFAPYEAGILLPQQIDESVFSDITFVDTRDAEQFEAGTIPGAVNIEWREVFSRLEDIPTDRKTVLFCNTGSLSAQAVFGLRVLGYDNVLVLQSGYTGWLTDAAYKP